MTEIQKPQRKNVIIFVLLLLAAAGLYLPWIYNPIMFDDLVIYSNSSIVTYAEHPFSIMPRQFPYFTLGVEYVMTENTTGVSHIVSALLHAINGFLVYSVARRLLGRIPGNEQRVTIISALLGLIFIVSPAATYGAAYLVQRTGMFATFFLLLATIQFDDAITLSTWRKALSAGVCFAIAAMCKEHATFGFIALLGLLALHENVSKSTLKQVLPVFLAIAIPVAAWVIYTKLFLVGQVYEKDAKDLMAATDFPDWGSARANWLLSIVIQCRFFFLYLSRWLWPNPAGMAIDVRPDFTELAQQPWVWAGPIALLVLFIGVMVVLSSKRSSPASKVAAFGLFWAMALFPIELASTRFQEAFVLYRSYLWAPGYLLFIGGLVSAIPSLRKAAPAALALFALICTPIAWYRLDSFSSGLKTWDDALKKMPRDKVTGSFRVHYNRAYYHFQERDYDAAQRDYQWLIDANPKAWQGYLGRASVYFQKKDYESAHTDLETVLRYFPDLGEANLRMGQTLRQLKREDEAMPYLEKAKKLGIPSFY